MRQSTWPDKAWRGQAPLLDVEGREDQSIRSLMQRLTPTKRQPKRQQMSASRRYLGMKLRVSLFALPFHERIFPRGNGRLVDGDWDAPRSRRRGVRPAFS